MSMSRNQVSTADTTAFALLAALESYELSLTRLVLSWPAGYETGPYREVSNRVEEIRSLCGDLPALELDWLALHISHTRMMQEMWQMAQGEPINLDAHLRGHLSCVRVLSAACRLLMAERPGQYH
jgi:hypothetical protein